MSDANSPLYELDRQLYLHFVSACACTLISECRDKRYELVTRFALAERLEEAKILRAPIECLIAFHEQKAKEHVSSQWIYSNHMHAVQAYKKVLQMGDQRITDLERQLADLQGEIR